MKTVPDKIGQQYGENINTVFITHITSIYNA
jgi:hypothetical protein